MIQLNGLTWNIHRAQGNDGIVDPQRSVDTLLTEVWRPDTDVLCLQEADAEKPPFGGILDLAQIEKRTGLRSVHAEPHLTSHPTALGFLGMVVLLSPSIAVEQVRLVDMAGIYPRGAVIVDARRNGFAFRLVATHLSLTQFLRIAQMRTLAQHLSRFSARPTVLCGDLNEWRPWGGLAFSRPVLGDRFSGLAPATFPVGRPVLPLDRFLVSAPGQVQRAEVLDGPAIRVTSDHRPLYAEIVLHTADNSAA